MVKINDTTSFPNTTPALGDHVPGTDVSNTANSADGETVTFLMSAIATLLADTSVTGMPINEAAWHPYNAATVGDGNDGMLFDHDVDGNSNFFSFTPEAGYDYRIVFEDLSHNHTSDRDLELSVTGTSTAETLFDVEAAMARTENVSGFVELFAPADLTSIKQVKFASILNMSAGAFSGANIAGRALKYSTEEAIATIDLRFSGNYIMDSGKIWLLRRRNYQKG